MFIPSRKLGDKHIIRGGYSMRKHFIAVLGTSDYKDCIYKFKDSEVRTRFIQDAVLQRVFQDFNEKEDKITILEFP